MDYHRLITGLICKLVDDGYHCFRFDFSGCGDSEGEIEGNMIKQWLNDVKAGYDVFNRIVDLNKLYFAGFRIGATLLMMSKTDELKVKNAILWDPVINGDRYINNLIQSHKRWVKGSFAKENALDKEKQQLGFMSDVSFSKEIRQINLLNVNNDSLRDILLIGDTNSDLLKQFYYQLAKLNCNADIEDLPQNLIPIRKMSKALEWISKH
jgi:hypothetical protein